MTELQVVLELISTFYPLIRDLSREGTVEVKWDDENMIATVEFKLKGKSVLTLITQTTDQNLYRFLRFTLKSAVEKLKKQ